MVKVMNRSLKFSIFFAPFICLFLLVNDAESSDLKKTFVKVKEMEILRARFGSGSDEIGITSSSECEPIAEGPTSFALSKDEEIYILDQVNSRIQVFKGGRRINSIPLKKDLRFKDIALTPDNKIVLLESFFKNGYEKRSIHILDSNGKTINVIPLEDGRLIPNSLEVIEILIVREGKFTGIWVVLENRSVRIASLDGKSVKRISVPGKLSLNGKRVLQAEKIGDITAVIYRSKEDSLSKWEPEYIVHFEMAIAYLLGIWDDQKERIYLGVSLEDQSKSYNTIVVFSPEGKELGYLNLFIQSMPHEIWQSIRVSSEGNIFQMALDEKGVFVRKYTLTE